MTNGQLNQLAEEVREEGYNQEGSMKDLVFDPVTGEFQQIECAYGVVALRFGRFKPFLYEFGKFVVHNVFRFVPQN